MGGRRLPGARGPRLPRAAPDSHGNGGGVVRWLGGLGMLLEGASRMPGRTADAGPRPWQPARRFTRPSRAFLRPAFIARQTHAWAVSDRIAFGEAPYDPAPPFSRLADRLHRLLRPIDLPSQLVHGDFTGNVLFAEGQPPAVIDLSPYWRPAGFAVAVVMEDALSWTDADESVLKLGTHIPEFRQLLIRATLRRILELDEHNKRGVRRFEEHLREYERTVAIIEGM